MRGIQEPKWWWEDPSEDIKDAPALESTYINPPMEGIVGMMDMMERIMTEAV